MITFLNAEEDEEKQNNANIIKKECDFYLKNLSFVMYLFITRFVILIYLSIYCENFFVRNDVMNHSLIYLLCKDGQIFFFKIIIQKKFIFICFIHILFRYYIHIFLFIHLFFSGY